VKKLTGTMKEATAASGLSRRHQYSLMGSGELASVKVGKRRLIVWESLEKLLLNDRGRPAKK
jgi:hypothetical protein